MLLELKNQFTLGLGLLNHVEPLASLQHCCVPPGQELRPQLSKALADTDVEMKAKPAAKKAATARIVSLRITFLFLIDN